MHWIASLGDPSLVLSDQVGSLCYEQSNRMHEVRQARLLSELGCLFRVLMPDSQAEAQQIPVALSQISICFHRATLMVEWKLYVYAWMVRHSEKFHPC